ncbi:MAG: hypothetical protein II828_05755 [Clostridia bacterium]|nr:hypothetical protein [Clostridia bacterium]
MSMKKGGDAILRKKDRQFEQSLYDEMRCAAQTVAVPSFDRLAAAIQKQEPAEPYDVFFQSAASGEARRHSMGKRILAAAACTVLLTVGGAAVVSLTSGRMTDMAAAEKAEEAVYEMYENGDTAEGYDYFADESNWMAEDSIEKKESSLPSDDVEEEFMTELTETILAGGRCVMLLPDED